MNTIDQATTIRAGEEFDNQKIEAFLKDSIPGLTGSMEVKQFPRGFSNLTYLIKFNDMEIVLRRPPFGKKAKSAHDMSREVRIQKALKPVFNYCPEPLLYSEDNSIMECPFYVMERIKGTILRNKYTYGFELNAKDTTKLCENLIDEFCEFHALEHKIAELDNFGRPIGYVKRQVEVCGSVFRYAW